MLFLSLGSCSVTLRWISIAPLALGWGDWGVVVAFPKVVGSGALRCPGQEEGGSDAWAPGAVAFTSVRDRERISCPELLRGSQEAGAQRRWGAREGPLVASALLKATGCVSGPDIPS